MRYIAILLAIFAFYASPLLAGEENSSAPAILSIIPGQAPPGTTVVVSGTGFNADSSLYLGIEDIPFKPLSARQISFEVPQLSTGNYALYIRQKSGAPSKAYSFAITSVKPAITAIHPDSISICSSGYERQISVKGKNFLEGARLLFDGAMIKGNRTSSEEIIFSVPAVPGGLHQVQVNNPEDTVSPAIALIISSRPEVRSVSQGDDYVNYYELNVEGLNFQHGSTLIVDGRKVHSGQPIPGERDRLVFTSCNRLIYQRYPYDNSMKSFQMVIVNPSGEESAPFTVSAP
ncbi:MAG: IPT/TIG domain-containing protein [Geobacteraceae bacterium]|nr:IPT/TIG domain-containing protein [Geobacteraceae bacterium]